MRIGIMCLAGLGGSARIATELASKLAQRGHRVHLFTRTDPFDRKNFAGEIRLHTVTSGRAADIHPAALQTDWPVGDFQKLLSCIMEVITTEGLDVLHFHYAIPFAFLAAEVKRSLNGTCPALVGTLHGTDVTIYGRTPTLQSQLTQAFSCLDQLTTVSLSHAHLSTELFHLPVRPEVIPNFVDLSKFQPQAPLSKGSNGSISSAGTGDAGFHLRRKPIIAHVSNFRPVKDTPSMARIFLEIRKQMEAELWLIGEGPELATVRSILQQSNYEGDIRYWGLQHNVAPLLAQADLLLMTSLSESFCLAALEAMACGVPVLAPKVGGLDEVVLHDKTGYLYPAGQHNAAVQIAIQLLSDPTGYQAMRTMAVQQAARFGHEQIVPAYERLYQRLLACRPQALGSERATNW